MIEAILPVPMRLKVGTPIINSRYCDCTLGMPDGRQLPVSMSTGRTLLVPPAYLFKIVSVWNNTVYEHNMLTFQPINLDRVLNGTELVPFYPISVKRYGGIHDSGTFLFIKSINSILADHSVTSLSASYETKTPDIVSGMAKLLDDCFGSPISKLVANPNLAVVPSLTPSMVQLMPLLCSASPAIACNFFHEMAAYMYAWDSFLDRYAAEATSFGVSMEECLAQSMKEHIYPESIEELDPITTLCCANLLVWPNQLLPQIHNNERIRGMTRMAQDLATYDTEQEHLPHQLSQDSLQIDTSANTFDYLIEEIGLLPFSDIRASITNDAFDGTINIRTSQLFQAVPVVNTTESLYNAMRELGRLYTDDKLPWKHITLSKNWVDEMYLTLEMYDGSIFRSYTHLSWAYLSSPALINQTISNAIATCVQAHLGLE